MLGYRALLFKVSGAATVYAIVVCTLLGCSKNNPLAARGQQINYGSGIQAVTMGISALRNYATNHGSFPPSGTSMASFEQDDVPAMLAASLQYGGNDSLTLSSSPQIILLKFVHPVNMSAGGQGYYCALLSGEVVLLTEKDANPGTELPPDKRSKPSR